MNDDALPRLLLMENVVGFETSGSCRRWREVLKDRNYMVAHFHLSPTQVGLPNDRPRYFCVAFRTKHADECTSTLPARSPDNWEQSFFSVEKNPSDRSNGPLIQKELPELDIQADDSVGDLPILATFIDASNDHDESLLVPAKLLASDSAWCFDWVTPNDSRSACFTQSYGRFVKGTGSVLYMGPPDARLDLKAPTNRKFHASWKEGLPPLQGYVRYFSGREMANLLGFGEGFSFPSDCTPKQQWRLLGNSLNVRVAARLCELGLRAKWAGK
jgi:tRNA (cytosine38-C5)-methyltransferase